MNLSFQKNKNRRMWKIIMELTTRVNVTKRLDVQIDVYELLNGLIDVFDLRYVLYPSYGWRWEIVTNKDSKKVLKRYTSPIGDPLPQVNMTIFDENRIKAYKCLKGLKEVIDKEMKKEKI